MKSGTGVGGVDSAQDFAAARGWYEKAAAAGDTDANERLAELKKKRR